jgi:glutamate dehydrogenase (NADP+)
MSQADILSWVKERNPNEPEFLQAAEEMITTVWPAYEKHPEFQRLRLLERLLEPERSITFRVTWLDDKNQVQVNRGYRIQMNSAIGPYKGGLRFHPSVNTSVLKFLAFEQIFKNALTGIPMGGGKGGSDFDPKGKSDEEVMKFCQAFMCELARHIHHRLDVPAGDIGVGAREIGYLFGAYKKIKNEAQYAIEKIIQLGGKAVTASDSNGFVYDEAGITREKLEFIKDLKNNRRGRIKEYAEKYRCAYHALKSDQAENPLWSIRADAAFPCATQNEITARDAQHLISNKVKLVCEGANMPVTIDAIHLLQANGVLYSPGKASNAGGVATSGLEMTQNYMGTHWTSEEVDNKLQSIMKNIHDICLATAKEYGQPGNYLTGANIAGFLKVASAMQEQGVV